MEEKTTRDKIVDQLAIKFLIASMNDELDQELEHQKELKTPPRLVTDALAKSYASLKAVVEQGKEEE